jgi:HTH-type transcriptional regulator/antitoxin HigA
MMSIFPIKNDGYYQAALAVVMSLMDAELNTPDGDSLDIWVTLVESYEAKQFPIAAPDSINAIKFRMEQQGLGLNDLTVYFGSLEKVKAFFDGKVQLTLETIIKLHDGLNIPLESLIKG